MKLDIEQIKADREAGTQGKWNMEKRTEGLDLPAFPSSPFLVVSDDCAQHAVADCSCNHTCRWSDECEANARRIARVPDLEDALIEYDEKSRHQYHIGPLVFAKVFQAAQLTNMHDMQAVLDAMEKALSE